MNIFSWFFTKNEEEWIVMEDDYNDNIRQRLQNLTKKILFEPLTSHLDANSLSVLANRSLNIFTKELSIKLLPSFVSKEMANKYVVGKYDLYRMSLTAMTGQSINSKKLADILYSLYFGVSIELDKGLNKYETELLIPILEKIGTEIIDYWKNLGKKSSATTLRMNKLTQSEILPKRISDESYYAGNMDPIIKNKKQKIQLINDFKERLTWLEKNLAHN